MSSRYGIQWSYKITPETAIRKALTLVAGVVLGAKLSFYKELDEGKRDLLLKYKQRFDEQQLGEQVEIVRSKIP